MAVLESSSRAVTGLTALIDQQSWPCWIGAFLLVLIFIYAALRTKGTEDNAPMPPVRRLSLGLFLLLLSAGLIYGIYETFTVEFSEVRSAEAFTVEPQQQPKDGTPIIKQFDPKFLLAGTSRPSLDIYGYNFGPTAKVRVDRVERATQVLSPNRILIPIEPVDVVSPRTVFVDVVVDSKQSTPFPLEIRTTSAQTGRLTLFSKVYWITEEGRLLLLVILAGALGSYIHAVKSLADFIGNQTLKTSWTWWYITRPFLGSPLAVIFYGALRGGFLVGTPADVKFVNTFGAFTVAALVGMFSDQATQKLAEIFDTLFKVQDKRSDKLTDLAIATSSLAKAKVNTDYSETLKAGGGKEPYEWRATGLPAGISVDRRGKIAGTTGTAGTFNLAVEVKDAEGKLVSKSIDLVIE
jgi:hypothetical protein